MSRLLSTFVASRVAGWVFGAIKAAMFVYIAGLLGRFIKRTVTGRSDDVAPAP